MDRPVGYQLIVGGLLLAGLGFLTHHLAPSLARPTLIAGLCGGGLCVLWGIQTVRDRGRKLLVVGTLIPVTFVLLSQTVVVWMGRVAVAGRTAAAVVITVLFLLSLAMLLRAAYAGVVFESSEPAGRRG